MKKLIKVNKKLWEQWTPINVKSDFYDLPSFLRGKNSLNELERNELGSVKGLSVLHLQCHFGMDTLSLARMGAEMTGVDFSESAISKAKELADLLQLKIDFILSDVYDIQKWVHKKFDRIFTSYGVITWLPDLKKWAEIISSYLKPGGFFYMVDFHPVLSMFDEDLNKIRYPYESFGVPIEFIDVPSYAKPELILHNRELNWHHGIGNIVNVLLQIGFRIEFLNEHFYSPYPIFTDMVEAGKARWIHKELKGKIPYLFSIRAEKI